MSSAILRLPIQPGESGITLGEVCRLFVAFKRRAVECDDMCPRTADDYQSMTERLLECIPENTQISSLNAEDFWRFRHKWKKWGHALMAVELARVRCLIGFATKRHGFKMPLDMGDALKGPSKKSLRVERSAKGLRMFSAEQIRALLAEARPTMRSMIYLGLNAALGNSDCARLEWKHLDLETGFLNFPRPKTGVDRRCPLWVETLEAIEESEQHIGSIRCGSGERPIPSRCCSDSLIFQGRQWVEGSRNSISDHFGRLCKKCGVPVGLGFYSLRRTCATIGSEAGDERALKMIMGHTASQSDITAVYVQRINDERLCKVVDHVREWLG